MGEKLKDQFTVLADKIMRRNSEYFKKESSEKLNQMLDPFKENLQNLRKKVEETYTSEKAERISLKDQIKELQGLNERLSKEADELVQALKGSSKSQGNWGEMLLETILENSGLVKGENYFREEELKDREGNAIKNESGRKMRPDVIVKYPDGRVIIIDSKVSLNAYVQFSEESDLNKQERYLDKHVLSIQNHIDNLSKKEYDQFERSPEFVMMFIPIEPAYHFALRHKPDLWSYAWEKRICLMSPTNLIAALRLVEEVWKKEKQNQNARDIADRAGKLYDKFVGVYDSFKKIGKHLKDATHSYEEAQNRLKDGRGSAIRQVEMLKELGAATKQSLPADGDEE
jgi:DNA recombination protein RmuC